MCLVIYIGTPKITDCCVVASLLSLKWVTPRQKQLFPRQKLQVPCIQSTFQVQMHQFGAKVYKQNLITVFTATIKKFAKHGDKTGWTYIEIPAAVAEQIKPDTKKTFRVKGTLDKYAINGVALLPMGGGVFIMALNATMRKTLKKSVGETVEAKLQWDEKERQL